MLTKAILEEDLQTFRLSKETPSAEERSLIMQLALADFDYEIAYKDQFGYEYFDSPIPVFRIDREKVKIENVRRMAYYCSQYLKRISSNYFQDLIEILLMKSFPDGEDYKAAKSLLLVTSAISPNFSFLDVLKGTDEPSLGKLVFAKLMVETHNFVDNRRKYVAEDIHLYHKKVLDTIYSTEPDNTDPLYKLFSMIRVDNFEIINTQEKLKDYGHAIPPFAKAFAEQYIHMFKLSLNTCSTKVSDDNVMTLLNYFPKIIGYELYAVQEIFSTTSLSSQLISKIILENPLFTFNLFADDKLFIKLFIIQILAHGSERNIKDLYGRLKDNEELLRVFNEIVVQGSKQFTPFLFSKLFVLFELDCHFLSLENVHEIIVKLCKHEEIFRILRKFDSIEMGEKILIESLKLESSDPCASILLPMLTQFGGGIIPSFELLLPKRLIEMPEMKQYISRNVIRKIIEIRCKIPESLLERCKDFVHRYPEIYVRTLIEMFVKRDTKFYQMNCLYDSFILRRGENLQIGQVKYHRGSTPDTLEELMEEIVNKCYNCSRELIVVRVDKSDRNKFVCDKCSDDRFEIPVCAICKDDINVRSAAIVTPCNHVFCRECLEKAVTYNPNCPTCAGKIMNRKTRTVSIDNAIWTFLNSCYEYTSTTFLSMEI